MGVKELQILLEKPEGVYYAGEVVRGTVQVVTDTPVQCRGLHVRLQGRSHVHWHSGQGENRTDYGGTTYFVEHRHVLWGNFYKTGLLDNAGDTAIFGKVSGDGIMYIPCEEREQHQWNLVVRVMDYDWGKRDDLLGEIVLDVASLARSKQPQSYPLTRFGKQGDGEVTLSARFLPRDALFLNHYTVAGQSGSHPPPFVLVLTVHQATGLRKADWIGKNDVYVQAYRLPPGNERRSRNQLPQPEKNTVLPIGKSVFPFSFQIPSSAPGSAELQVGDNAYVRYDLYTNVDLAHWRDPSSRIAITVLPNRPIASSRLLSPVSRDFNDQLIHECSCFCLKCNALDGLISITLQLSRQSYAPGETVDPKDSKVVNSSSKELPVALYLCQHIRLRSARGSTQTCSKKYLLGTGTCPAKTTLLVSNILQKMVIPPIFPSFHGGDIEQPYTRTRYPCLLWSYSIEICVGVEKITRTNATANLPILIAVAPPFADAIKQASSNSVSPILDPFEIFGQAITGPEPCDTTPHITGPEDGGHLTTAWELETGIKISMAEDTYAVGMSPLYTPYVNTFDSSPEGPQNNFQAFDTPSSPSTTEIDITALLEIMANSYDKRRAVGEWVKAHPDTASRLSPAQVAQVLTAVSFSLDQPSVAGELTTGMERTLTCAHVLEAMRVCPYQKVDVAQTMVPYVRDPENQNLVLSEIEFSFERDRVEGMFRSH